MTLQVRSATERALFEARRREVEEERRAETALLQKALELKDKAASQRQALAAAAREGQQTLNRWVHRSGMSSWHFALTNEQTLVTTEKNIVEYLIVCVCVCVGRRGLCMNSRSSQSYNSWRRLRRSGGEKLRSSGGRWEGVSTIVQMTMNLVVTMFLSFRQWHRQRCLLYSTQILKGLKLVK